MGSLNMNSDPYLSQVFSSLSVSTCIMKRVLYCFRSCPLVIWIPEQVFSSISVSTCLGQGTNELTPKVCNNVKSNDLDANRLLFEHVKMQKNTNFTRSYKSLVSKDDDASAGSDVIQPEELEQHTRDVVNNVVGSLTCLDFHF